MNRIYRKGCLIDSATAKHSAKKVYPSLLVFRHETLLNWKSRTKFFCEFVKRYTVIICLSVVQMSVHSLADRLTRDLLSFAREIERERAEFQLEKSEFENKIIVLEAQNELKDRTIRDLTRRVALLEFAVRKDARISDPPSLLPEISAPEISPVLLDTLRRPAVRSCRSMLTEFLENLEISNSVISDHRKISRPRLRLLRRVAVALEPPTRFAISDLPKFPLVTGGGDGGIFLWTEEISDQPPRGFRGHEGVVTCGVVHRKSGSFISAGFDGTLRKFADFSDQIADHAVAFVHNEVVWCLAIDEVSDLLISGGADCRLVFSRPETLSKESEITVENVPVSINFSGERILVITHAGVTNVFDRKSFQRLSDLPPHREHTSFAATSATVIGDLYCVGLKSGNLIVYDLRSGNLAVKSLALASVSLTALSSLSPTPNSAFLLVGDVSGVVRLFDVDSLEFLDELSLDTKIESMNTSNLPSSLVALADGSVAELVLQH